jgi:hypothetical protein
MALKLSSARSRRRGTSQRELPGRQGPHVQGGDPRKRLGAALRSARLEHREDVLSVKAWAALIGYGKDYVSGVETGNSWPSRQFVSAYENQCDLPTGCLVALHEELDSARAQPFELIPSTGSDSSDARSRPRTVLFSGFAAIVIVMVVTTVVRTLASSGPKVETAEINAPSDGSRVCYEALVTGSWEHLGLHKDLWVIVKPLLTGIYYPQPGPATLTRSGHRGTWTATAYLGERDKGYEERFEIVVIGAPSPESRMLSAIHQTHSGLAGPPPGTRQLHALTVTRDTC